jgi:hypothetical protein
MHRRYAFGYRRDLLFAGSIDQADTFVSLIDDNQKWRRFGADLCTDSERNKANCGQD